MGLLQVPSHQVGMMMTVTMMMIVVVVVVLKMMMVVMMTMIEPLPRAHLDRMKSKEGAVVDEECPTAPLLSGDIFLMSSDEQDFDMNYGGLIVATGVLLSKPFILAFF